MGPWGELLTKKVASAPCQCPLAASLCAAAEVTVLRETAGRQADRQAWVGLFPVIHGLELRVCVLSAPSAPRHRPVMGQLSSDEVGGFVLMAPNDVMFIIPWEVTLSQGPSHSL